MITEFPSDQLPTHHTVARATEHVLQCRLAVMTAESQVRQQKAALAVAVADLDLLKAQIRAAEAAAPVRE